MKTLETDSSKGAHWVLIDLLVEGSIEILESITRVSPKI